MRSLLLVLSTVLLLVSPVAYGVSIIKGRSQPHRLTRIALMAAMLLSFFSAIGADANTGTLLAIGIGTVHCVVIALLSLWRGMGGESRFDWLCFGLAIAGLVGWQISGNALVGIWFAIFADAMAYVPAVIKTWRHPETEGPWFYILAAVGTVVGLVAYPFAAASVFQAYLILCSLTMLACIYRKQLSAALKLAETPNSP